MAAGIRKALQVSNLQGFLFFRTICLKAYRCQKRCQFTILIYYYYLRLTDFNLLLMEHSIFLDSDKINSIRQSQVRFEKL
jgi:hypothetical protein